MIPVILDTDIGDDIDDAFALALICSSPECDLRAVTTVYGDTVERARLAATVLTHGGRCGVPVGIGCPGGLSVRHRRGLERLRTRDGLNQAGLGLAAEALPPPDRRHAAQLIIDTIRAGDGDVVPIAIGALTNLALALTMDPGLANRIPRLVLMAGEFERGFAEWNIACDPVAAEIVFSSGIAVELTPWTIGSLGTLTISEVDRLAGSAGPLAGFVATCTQAWMATHPGETPHLYDPLAVVGMLRPELFTWRTGTVAIETAGALTCGTSRMTEGAGRHRVMTGLDRDRAIGVILDRIISHSAAVGSGCGQPGGHRCI
jgi:inosine-uridine nucleoside N-ribohydrolase